MLFLFLCLIYNLAIKDKPKTDDSLIHESDAPLEVRGRERERELVIHTISLLKMEKSKIS